jgi:pimeloyl-[acyl-carrier protein] methyl ester esterase
MLIATRGGGPPLVLIHGWAMHAGLFGGLLDRLAEHRTLYLVDLPGHGRSRDDGSPLALAPCVAEIAAQTPSAPWLGWSLGGLFALHAAVAHPAHVEALVMLCSTPRFVRAADWPHGMDVDVFRTFGANLEGDFRGTIERFLALETLGCERATAELRTLRSEAFAFGEPAPAAPQPVGQRASRPPGGLARGRCRGGAHAKRANPAARLRACAVPDPRRSIGCGSAWVPW